MNRTEHIDLHLLLSHLQSGEMSLEEVKLSIESTNGFLRTASATIDTERGERCGLPEVIYCESKSAEQIIEVAGPLRSRAGVAFGTRCSAEKGEIICREFPDADYDQLSRTIRIGSPLKSWTGTRFGMKACDAGLAKARAMPIPNTMMKIGQTASRPCHASVRRAAAHIASSV